MNFEAAIQALADAEVDFVIIGGWGAILNGSSYVTNDLDLCYSRGSLNLRRLVRALAPFRPRLRDLPEGLPFIWDEATLRNGSIFNLETDLGKIDLIAEIPGLGSYDQIIEGTVTAAVFGRIVRTLDLRTLIRAKRASGREKDLRILPELESLLEAEES